MRQRFLTAPDLPPVEGGYSHAASVPTWRLVKLIALAAIKHHVTRGIKPLDRDR